MYQLSEIIPCPSSLFHIISEGVSATQKSESCFGEADEFYQFLDYLVKLVLSTFVIKCISIFSSYLLKETINWSSCVTHSEAVLHYFLIRFFPQNLFFPCISCPSLFELK